MSNKTKLLGAAAAVAAAAAAYFLYKKRKEAKPDEEKLVQRLDYKPPPFFVETVDLNFILTEEEAVVESKSGAWADWDSQPTCASNAPSVESPNRESACSQRAWPDDGDVDRLVADWQLRTQSHAKLECGGVGALSCLSSKLCCFFDKRGRRIYPDDGAHARPCCNVTSHRTCSAAYVHDGDTHGQR